MRLPLDADIGWGELAKRTLRETVADNCFGMAAQLAYYFFLSLFPALLIVVALTGVFPSNLLDSILHWVGIFTPPEVLDVVRGQIEQIRHSGHAGLLTFGALGALWSSSSAMSAIVDTLNRAYGVKEARPWWKIQLLAIVMVVVMSAFMLLSFTLVVSGPEIAETIAARMGLGPVFEWTWKILQWPIVFLVISLGLFDWLMDDEIADVFRKSGSSDFLHAIAERRPGIQQWLHRSYVQLAYGYRTDQYRPRYFTCDRIKSLADVRRPLHVYRSWRLSFGALISSLPIGPKI